MHLASDYVHPTPHKGRCRVRIYVPDSAEDSYVVVFSELASNTGQSVTNCIEQLAAGVIQANVKPTSQTVVIEHYESAAHGGKEDETYDLVTFSVEDPEPILRAGVWTLELGAPAWQHLDRGAVETLLGMPLSR